MRCPPSVSVADLREACDYLLVPFNESTVRCKNLSKYNIGFLGQIRQIRSQSHFHAFKLKLFCLSICYYISNSEFGHPISFLS